MDRSIFRRVRNTVNSCVDRMLLAMPMRVEEKRVLLVRLDAIGDFVLWLDAARELVRHVREQGQKAILIGDSVWASWAAELGIFDDVISFDRRAFLNNPLYRIRLVLEVRRLGCATAIHPVHSRVFGSGDAMTRLCGARTRIGSSGDTANQSPGQKAISDGWYTRLVPLSSEPQMELVRNAAFVRGVLGNDFQAGVPDLRSYAGTVPKPRCADEVEDGEPLYVLFPGASFGNKVWPAARFAEVAALLYAETGWRGVVCGGPAETMLAASMCEEASAPLLNWAGKTSLAELCWVLARARLLITNDSSAVHLGTAVGLPSVCILGGGHYGRFLPYQVEREAGRVLPSVVIHAMDCFGCNWNCVFPTARGEAKPCVTGVTVEQVWERVRQILRLERDDD